MYGICKNVFLSLDVFSDLEIDQKYSNLSSSSAGATMGRIVWAYFLIEFKLLCFKRPVSLRVSVIWMKSSESFLTLHKRRTKIIDLFFSTTSKL